MLDAAATLALVLAGGEWRSPFYLLAVSSLILPAATLPPRRALAAALLFSSAYLAIAMATGIDWGTLGSTARLESFATHLIIPGLVALALTYASSLLDDLERERQHPRRSRSRPSGAASAGSCTIRPSSASTPPVSF